MASMRSFETPNTSDAPDERHGVQDCPARCTAGHECGQRRRIDRAALLHRTTTAMGAMIVTIACGSLPRLLAPLSAYAAAANGLWLGNVRKLGSGGPLAYTDPASGDPAVLLRLAGGHYVSYDTVCTHRGCTVLYDTTSKMLVCPCHGATFDPAHQGAVTAGPTRIPLMPLPVTVTAAGDVYLLGAKPGPLVNRLRPAQLYTGQTGDDGGGGRDGGIGGGSDDGVGAATVRINGQQVTVSSGLSGRGFVASPLSGGTTPTTRSHHGRRHGRTSHGDD